MDQTPGSDRRARRDRIDVLGVAVDAAGPGTVRAWLDAVLAEPSTPRCRHVATANPEYVMAARRDPAFAAALRAADLVTADGVGVLVAGRRLGGVSGRRLGRVTGVELVEWLAAASGPAVAPLFLLGAGPGVAEAAGAALSRRFPSARIAGRWGGGTPDPRDDAAALGRIGASGARVVLVAYGARGQVTWIERNREALTAAGVRVAVGVGGALDYVAGHVPWAPAGVRRLGLEWLYRLVREPRRWRRQLALPRFAALTLRELLIRAWRRGNRAGRVARLAGETPRPEERPASPSPARPEPGADPAPMQTEEPHHRGDHVPDRGEPGARP